jgi:dihydroorotate dehydrogenase (NAD+) catalytic subunit
VEPDGVAQAVQDAKADALTCINTLPAMAIDERSRKPILGNITGGLSGPAIKPVAMKAVWDVSRSLHIPVIASGGIIEARDVIQFMLAGATAVQIGSAGLRDPFTYLKILEGIREYMSENKMEVLADLIGALEI